MNPTIEVFISANLSLLCRYKSPRCNLSLDCSNSYVALIQSINNNRFSESELTNKFDIIQFSFDLSYCIKQTKFLKSITKIDCDC
jgi:hypothetical protein